jgi:RNA polymerase sigma-70 factor (ECF subfamily)
MEPDTKRAMTDWEQLYDRHAQAVWNTAYRLLRDENEACDAVQEAFVSAMEYGATNEVRNWAGLLRRMATARALDRLRLKIRRRQDSTGGFDLNLLGDPAASSRPESGLDRRDLAEALRRALGRLPARQAEVFYLRCVEEMSYAQIARETGLSAGNVGVVLHRARGRLRQLLGAELYVSL